MVNIKKILLVLMLSGFGCGVMADIGKFMGKLDENRFQKIKLKFGDNSLYLNYGMDEFKEDLLYHIRNKENESDELYRLLGMKTYGESWAEKMKKYLAGEGFAKSKNSPAFALRGVNAIFVDYNKILNNKFINIHKYYEDGAVGKHEVIYENKEGEIKDPQKIKTKFQKKVDAIFVDWSWFLQGVDNEKTISLDEVSDNNLKLSWVVLHEAAHVYNDGGFEGWDYVLNDNNERKLIKEMHSDIYAATHIPSINAKEHYKKIDSMMFSRMMSLHNSTHFTIAPLMALKIMISKPGFWESHMVGLKKERVARELIKVSKSHVGAIIRVADMRDEVGSAGIAGELKGVVKKMVVDLNSALY